MMPNHATTATVEHIGTAPLLPEALEALDFVLSDDAANALMQSVSECRTDARPPTPPVTANADTDQMRAIVEDAPIIRLLAPAGSGKTQTLANRIVRLLANGTSPDTILTLTFDNAAASSLANKLATLGAPHKPRTLNAFSYGLLRNFRPDLHKPIANLREQSLAFRNARQDLKTLPHFSKLWPDQLKDGVFRSFFGIMKNNCVDPRDTSTQMAADFILGSPVARQAFFSKAETADDVKGVLELIIRAFRSTDRQLIALGKMDFDDQKLRCFVAMKNDAALRAAIASQYRHVIVDEFQDINPLDLELIRYFSAKSSLLVTGDDDQAIYGFRGCSPYYILNLASVLGEPILELDLRFNYRCPPNIVHHSDKLIQHNQFRAAKNPVAVRTDDAAIKVVSSTTAGVEAKAAVRFIKKIVQRRGSVTYDDCVILYRTNAQSLPLQLHLLLEGVPYSIRDEHNILKNEQLGLLLGVLRSKLAVVEDRDPELDDLLCLPKAFFRYWSEADSASLARHLRNSSPRLTALRNVSSAVSSKVANGNFKSKLTEMLAAKGLTRTLTTLAESFSGLRGMIGSLEDVIDNAAPFAEIFELAASYRGRLGEFVRALETALTQDQYGEEAKEGRVALSTYFGAKGLQWHTVVMTGCSDGLIPHARGDRDEERRLFYVAMTRASANLYISYLAKSCGHTVSPSPFLFEAGLLTKEA